MTGTTQLEQKNWRCHNCGTVVSATRRPDACPDCNAVGGERGKC